TYFVQVRGFGSAFGTYSLVASINSAGSGSGTLLSAAGGGLSMELDGLASSPFSFAAAPPSTSVGSTSGSARVPSQATSESSEQNDLALLAWLSNSSGTGQPGAPSSLADNDSLAAHGSDEPDAVDVAFELLEGNALAAATI